MITSFLSLSETASKLRNGDIDLISFINSLCDRIDKVEPEIHSLLPEENRRNRLLNEVKLLLQKYPDKNNRPPFFGIPIGVKDIFITDGFETHCGSNLPAKLFEGTEASCVTKLKEQGALILGKTVTTEFAYFEPGPTKNPCNTKHTPGGSSSGSAAAVAAGITTFAFGTQTIGSVIRPAAYCGVIGFKPSYGRIATDGVIPFSQSADHIGFFTHDIDGCILAASILCKNWKTNADNQVNHKFIVGIPEGKYLEQASGEIISEFEKQLKILENKGIIIKRIKLFDDIKEINRLQRLMVAAEMAEVHKEWFANYEPLYKPNTKQIIEEGKKINQEELSKAKDGRFLLRKEIEILAVNNNLDCWFSPSTLTFPPQGLESTGSPLMNLPWTYAGLPTINIPAGKNTDNLPFGLQFTGFYYQDETLLAQVKEIFSGK
jgi:Asp-tRNA(Asn)/Glu-tRNA(Gln) amidotransferase A subunit family amidase